MVKSGHSGARGNWRSAITHIGAGRPSASITNCRALFLHSRRSPRSRHRLSPWPQNKWQVIMRTSDVFVFWSLATPTLARPLFWKRCAKPTAASLRSRGVRCITVLHTLQFLNRLAKPFSLEWFRSDAFYQCEHRARWSAWHPWLLL